MSGFPQPAQLLFQSPEPFLGDTPCGLLLSNSRFCHLHPGLRGLPCSRLLEPTRRLAGVGLMQFLRPKKRLAGRGINQPQPISFRPHPQARGTAQQRAIQLHRDGLIAAAHQPEALQSWPQILTEGIEEDVLLGANRS